MLPKSPKIDKDRAVDHQRMAGLIVVYAGTRLLLAMAFPGAQNVPIDAKPSGVVLAFAFAISLLTGILFGVAPAFSVLALLLASLVDIQ